MNLLFFINLVIYTSHIVSSQSPNQTDEIVPTTPPPEDAISTNPTSPENMDEDQQIITESIAKYGLPQNYKALGLPGPELETGWDIYSVSNELISGESGMYTLKVRTIAEDFSYNGRYEDTKLRMIKDQETILTKGQFGEHFERKSGGYYIRIIGYTLDENGYRQFLINLSKAKTIIEEGTSELPVTTISDYGDTDIPESEAEIEYGAHPHPTIFISLLGV
ncbi:hypothetical protein Zmor_015329 [Zophobas morio]|uniref:Uncharacterized protein n=1 Tax=Zophobas morio TaxID=2755281 RepID=A0AA38IJ02_9CUCU|nr:hypothetical protein Zmor_015329 [Zophobas morio]